ERVPEMVLHGGLVDGQQVGAKPRLQRVRAECAERDGGGERVRGNEKADLAVHHGRGRGLYAQFVYNDALALRSRVQTVPARIATCRFNAIPWASVSQTRSCTAAPPISPARSP